MYLIASSVCQRTFEHKQTNLIAFSEVTQSLFSEDLCGRCLGSYSIILISLSSTSAQYLPFNPSPAPTDAEHFARAEDVLFERNMLITHSYGRPGLDVSGYDRLVQTDGIVSSVFIA